MKAINEEQIKKINFKIKQEMKKNKNLYLSLVDKYTK